MGEFAWRNLAGSGSLTSPWEKCIFNHYKNNNLKCHLWLVAKWYEKKKKTVLPLWTVTAAAEAENYSYSKYSEIKWSPHQRNYCLRSLTQRLEYTKRPHNMTANMVQIGARKPFPGDESVHSLSAFQWCTALLMKTKILQSPLSQYRTLQLNVEHGANVPTQPCTEIFAELCNLFNNLG